MKGFQKRGQITVFIILGIIILMSSATYFYVKKQTTGFLPGTTQAKKTTALHPYVEECLEFSVREALGIVGTTGGYITYPMGIQGDPASYLKTSPIDEVKMPYWWYAGEIRIPPLEFIQSQVEEFIIGNIDSCIDNFTAIKDYEVYKTDEIDARITFGEYDVAAELKYPLRAIKIPQRNEFSLNNFDFFIKVPIRFKEVYDTAQDIMNDENQQFFMEYWTMDLISLADNPGEDYTTPLMGIEFSLKPRFWKLSTIRENLKGLLTANVQYIKFGNTNYNPIPDIFPYMQNHYVWNAFDEYKQDVHVSATYDSTWPFRIAIFPTKAGVLKPGTTRIGKYLSFIGIQTWHFTYDLVYPVIVTVKADETKKSDEYSFSYAFLVSIQKNRPYRQNFGSTIFQFNDVPSEKEECDYLTSQFDMPMTVTTYNEYTNKPIRDVELTFTCARYVCPLGVTDWTTHGASASLSTNFPYCTNGILRGAKQGFETAEMFVTTESGKNIQLKLKPVVEYYNYTVVKHLYTPDNIPARQVGAQEVLFDDEEAVIIINPYDGEEQYALFPSSEPMPIKLFKDKDFKYNITIYLFDDDVLLGGYDSTVTFTESDVENNNHIKFHVLEYSAKDDEDLALFLTGLKSYSNKVPQPQFETIK